MGVEVPRVAREWAAGGVGCALADTIFNPLEVLKTRRQVALLGTAPGAAPESVASLASKALRERGLVAGLWAPGLGATWLRGLSYTGFRIGLYPTVLRRVSDAAGGDTLLTRGAAGAATGVAGAALFAPCDVVRIRMQRWDSSYASTPGAFAAIASGEGVKGLWRGASAAVARAALLSGSQLASYDTAKRGLKARGWEEGPLLHFAGSMVSGLVAQTVTMPADTMRTVMMSGGERAREGGLLAAAASVVRQGGPMALYRGYWPALARQGPVMVVQMPLVEQLRALLGLGYF